MEAHVAALAPRLVARGAHVTVYCRARYNPHGNCYREGVRLADVPTVYDRSAEALVHTALCAPRACIRHDVVHLHACGPGLFSGVPGALGRRSVVTLHGRDWTRDKWGPMARSVLRLGAAVSLRAADALVAVSGELTSWCREQGREATHLPNGVEPHQPVDWDAQIFPMLRPGKYLLFLGRLVPEKGLDTLVAAAARAQLDLPVVITGGSAYTPGFMAHLRKIAPEERVIFTGPQFGLEKRMLLTHARAFVLPSRVEGLPVALLEGMAAGLPPLVSDIAPNVEVAGDVGWRAPVGDVEAWTRVLRQVAAASPSALEAIGAAGRQRALARFGWDHVADRTMAIYEALAR
ncbi:MAG: glycosyltransferase family 4 protein [Deltaproteobacteria bacterium]|nr:glycosyltransferase family 4 protein [Deltaproteobacteria bacterium]